jgi:hypothetical protein
MCLMTGLQSVTDNRASVEVLANCHFHPVSPLKLCFGPGSFVVSHPVVGLQHWCSSVCSDGHR